MRETLPWLIMLVAIVFVPKFIGATGAGVNAYRANTVLTAAGFTDIQITGYSWWGCGVGDWYQTAYIAKGPTGVITSGIVCEGWLPWSKDATIRYN